MLTRIREVVQLNAQLAAYLLAQRIESEPIVDDLYESIRFEVLEIAPYANEVSRVWGVDLKNQARFLARAKGGWRTVPMASVDELAAFQILRTRGWKIIHLHNHPGSLAGNPRIAGSYSFTHHDLQAAVRHGVAELHLAYLDGHGNTCWAQLRPLSDTWRIPQDFSTIFDRIERDEKQTVGIDRNEAQERSRKVRDLTWDRLAREYGLHYETQIIACPIAES